MIVEADCGIETYLIGGDGFYSRRISDTRGLSEPGSMPRTAAALKRELESWNCPFFCTVAANRLIKPLDR
jgi:hypothetical protein